MRQGRAAGGERGGATLDERAVWIGIDVAKDWLDVADAGEGPVWRVGNDADGIAALVEALTAHSPRLVVLEPTGGLAAAVAAALAAAGVAVAVVNPAQARHFAQASGQRATTAALDARVLARFGERMRPAARPLPDETAQELRGILARRQLVEIHTAEANRRPTIVASLRPELEEHLAHLEAQLAALDRAWARLIADSPVWRTKEDLLRSIPGVGPVVARTLLAELPELGTLSRQEAAARAGLAPINRDRGRPQRPRGIGGGRGAVRAKLSMAALTAVRCDPTMHAFYDRLIRHGKPAQVALVACMRKLLAVANAVLRDSVPWRAPGGAMA